MCVCMSLFVSVCVYVRVCSYLCKRKKERKKEKKKGSWPTSRDQFTKNFLLRRIFGAYVYICLYVYIYLYIIRRMSFYGESRHMFRRTDGEAVGHRRTVCGYDWSLFEAQTSNFGNRNYLKSIWSADLFEAQTSNNYDCQNFQQVFSGVSVHIKHVFSGVPKIWQVFNWGNGVPVTQKRIQDNWIIWRSKYLKVWAPPWAEREVSLCLHFLLS